MDILDMLKHHDGVRIRSYEFMGEQWFSLSELLFLLGRNEPANLEEAESGVYSIYDTPSSGNLRTFDINEYRTAECVNAAGLFEVVFGVDTAEAKAIQRWILTEFLPVALVQTPTPAPMPSLAKIRRSRFSAYRSGVLAPGN